MRPFSPLPFRHKPALWITLLLGLLTVTGCRQFLSVAFDLPPKAEKPAPLAAPSRALAFQQSPDLPPPAIEGTLDPDSVVQMLPRDHAGNIDWMEAYRSGVIRPRNGLSNDSVRVLESDFNFGFDFFFEGPAPALDAFFPHSAHTKWVNCQQCHSRIFKYRDTDIKMADVLQGKYCGECHGKVAFPPVTGCERCHPGLPQPANRAQPELLGTIRLTRVEQNDSDSLIQASVNENTDSLQVSPTVSASLISDASLPEAVFPHWVHRIRFTCKTCHMEIFEPKAGANKITMADISAGEACGKCHDGKTAFPAGFGTCHRCHVEEDEKAP